MGILFPCWLQYARLWLGLDYVKGVSLTGRTVMSDYGGLAWLQAPEKPPKKTRIHIPATGLYSWFITESGEYRRWAVYFWQGYHYEFVYTTLYALALRGGP